MFRIVYGLRAASTKPAAGYAGPSFGSGKPMKYFLRTQLA